MIHHVRQLLSTLLLKKEPNFDSVVKAVHYSIEKISGDEISPSEQYLIKHGYNKQVFFEAAP